MLQCL